MSEKALKDARSSKNSLSGSCWASIEKLAVTAAPNSAALMAMGSM